MESGWNPAGREPIRASVATLVFPMKSPLNWGRAHRPEGSLFGHWRSGMEFAQVSCRSTRRGVRGHPAPSGALRQECQRLLLQVLVHPAVRGHPAPSGALRRDLGRDQRHDVERAVRGHPAPSGALRPVGGVDPGLEDRGVREHPAPSGALRQLRSGLMALHTDSQGAPSTIRCIKTDVQRLTLGCRGESGSTQHHQVH